MEKKVYSFLQQAAVFAIIMLIANGWRSFPQYQCLLQ